MVASFTDAWIETSYYFCNNVLIESHLLQMRGLKQPLWEYENMEKSRIFYRCVD